MRRIGIARDFLGADPDVNWVVEASLEAMRRAGATVVDALSEVAAGFEDGIVQCRASAGIRCTIECPGRQKTDGRGTIFSFSLTPAALDYLPANTKLRRYEPYE